MVDSATELFGLLFFRTAQHIDFCTFLNERGYPCNGTQSSNFAFAAAWFMDDVLQKYFFEGVVKKEQASLTKESKAEECMDGYRSEAAIPPTAPVLTATYSIFSPKDPGYRPKPSSTTNNAKLDRATAFVKENAFESLTNEEARICMM